MPRPANCLLIEGWIYDWGLLDELAVNGYWSGHYRESLDASIKQEIDANRLIRRGYVVLAISSLINFLSMLYFLALVWHTTAGNSAPCERCTVIAKAGCRSERSPSA